MESKDLFVIFLFSLLLLLSLPYAAASTIFDDYRNVGGNFTFHGYTFTVQYLPKQKQALLQSNLRDFLLQYGECKKALVYTFCFEEMKFDPGNGYGVVMEGMEIPAIRLTVDFQKPELQITRTFSRTDALVGDYSTITVKVKNPTKEVMEHILYRDAHPQGVQIFGRALPGNIFEETVERLLPGEQKVFAYTIRFEESTAYTNKARVQYSIGNIDFRQTSDQAYLLVKSPKEIPPYQLLLFLDDYAVEMGEKARLHAVIENYENEELEIVYVHVYLPEGLQFSAGDFKEAGNKYASDGFVFGRDYKEFVMEFVPAKEGNFPIVTEAGVRVATKLVEREAATMLNVEILPLEIKVRKREDKEQNTAELQILAKNPNVYVTLEEIKVDLVSEYFTFNEAVLNRLLPKEERELYNVKFRLDEAEQHPYFQLIGRYIVGKHAKKIQEDIYLRKPGSLPLLEDTFAIQPQGQQQASAMVEKVIAKTVIVSSEKKQFVHRIGKDGKFILAKRLWLWYRFLAKIFSH
ncbi:hypothetical protein HYS48_03595 [Candidatus Woesearchaeota archaeon]|nr:hypothetical protein [Candidatus Woesearchaeota archaeon]